MKIQVHLPEVAFLEAEASNLYEFLRNLYKDGKEWGIDYSTVSKTDLNTAIAADFFWRLFRAFRSGSVVVVEENVYKVSTPQDKNEILDRICTVAQHLDSLDEPYWFDEQNDGIVAIILKPTRA